MDRELTRPPIHTLDNPTDELLLSFLRLPWAPSPPADGSLDEPQATALARRALAQGLGPLLYARLRGQEVLPQSAMAELRQAYYESAGRSARINHALETILQALAASGVPAILLKGAALAQAIYGNPALRPMGDLDLLVRPADVDTALATLAGLGYRPWQHEPAPGSTRTYENEILLRREGAPAPLEVHWGLFDSPHYQERLPMEWFWQTARPLPATTPQQDSLPVEPVLHTLVPGPSVRSTSVQGLGSRPPATAWILGPEAQILHLCGHLFLHHGPETRLLWWHDVAEVIVHYRQEIDWPTLLGQASACDLVYPLQQVLPRIASEWRAPIPPAALEELRLLRPSRAEERIYARLSAGYRPAGRRLWDDLADTPSCRRRLHLAWVNIFPTSAYMRQRYGIRHRLLVPFFYPYRWFLGLRGLLLSRKTQTSGPESAPADGSGVFPDRRL